MELKEYDKPGRANNWSGHEKERKMDEKKIKELLEEIEKLKGDKYLSAHLGWMQIANLATDLLRKEK